MEHLMASHLNEPQDTWTPWGADEEMFFAIMTGQLTPDIDEAPVIGTHEGFLTRSAA
jgi:hypothetical protein